MCQPTAIDGQPASAREDVRCASASADGDGRGESRLSLARRTLERGTLFACASVLLLITGLSVTFPHMQSRRDALGCDALCFGTMTSVRSALGLVGTAVMGRLSDRNGTVLARTLGSVGRNSAVGGDAIGRVGGSGRRACLYVGTLASLVGLAVAASVDSLLGLWISMIPGALLQHNFDVFKALLSEYHNDIEHLQSEDDDQSETGTREDGSSPAPSFSRAGSVGKLGMAAGISFMIGPSITALASPTFRTASYLAMLCTLASGIIIFQLPLPIGFAKKRNDQIKDHEKTKPQCAKSEFTLMAMLKLESPKSRAAVFLLVLRLNMALAFHVFNTVWPASLKARFSFGPSDHARFMSFIGITYAISQGFLAKRLVRMSGDNGKVSIIMACCAVLGMGRYVAYYTKSLPVVYAVFLFIINALGTLNTVITADTGLIAPSNEIGGLFGILQASESAAGMIGPVVGGVISAYCGKDAPLIAVVGVYSFLFCFVSWGYERQFTSSHEAKPLKKSI